MASAFPGAPKVLRGGLVALHPPELETTHIVFQYNPDAVQRQVSMRGAEGGGGRGDAQRVNGVPAETISLTVEIDAADQLEKPRENAVTVRSGLHPVIAALEGLLYPGYAAVTANQELARAGSAFILGEQAPLVLLVWGRRRVVPVQIERMSIREQAFDSALNPIRMEIDFEARVLTYRDLDPANPGYWVYMSAFAQKEVLAEQNIFSLGAGRAPVEVI